MISIQRPSPQNDLTDREFAVYLEDIRQSVCSRCPQRPVGGPPCAPRGWLCEVELHLPVLIDSLDRDSPSPACGIGRSHWRDVGAIYRFFRLAAGTWTGCDWPTRFTASRLDLNDWPSLGAQIMARKARSPKQRRQWRLAARWLARIEKRAKRAERLAGLAVAAANVGQWPQARKLAAAAWALESATGRPYFRGLPPTWKRLAEIIEAAALARESSGETIDSDTDPRDDHPARWPVILVSSTRLPQGL